MKNFIQPGLSIRLTAPAGGVVSGAAYLLGNMFGVAQQSVSAGQPFELATEGVFTLPKPTAQAQAEGAAVYWDDTAKNVTTTVATNKKIGHVAKLGGHLAADTSGDFRLAQT